MYRPIEKPWTLRRRIVGGLLGALFRRDRGLPLLRPEEIDRVLLIRYDRLGDAIVSTPLIESLRLLNDRVEIDVLAGPHNAALLRADSRISRVFVWDGGPLRLPGVVRQVRRREYDLVLQLILGKTTNPTIVAGLCSKRGRIVGRGNSYNRRLFDHFVRPPRSLHFADQTWEVLLDAIDFPERPAMPGYRIALPQEVVRETTALLSDEGLETGGWVMLNASAGESHRAFGTDRGAELATELARVAREHRLRIAISGAPADTDLVATMAEASGGVPLRFPSVLHLSCAIREAALLVTPDTGPVHIASALGTPVVAYYSEHDKPEGWSPRGVPHRIVVAPVHGDVETVPVEEIVQGAAELLERSHPIH